MCCQEHRPRLIGMRRCRHEYVPNLGHRKMKHFHCFDINPTEKALQMKGRNLLVSFAYPARVKLAHEIGQEVLLDNGAFSVWRQGKEIRWSQYYAWVDEWLDCSTTWCIIPDVIDAGEAAQDRLLADWPWGRKQSAPVWHTDESYQRLARLVEMWPRVCIGSSKIHPIGSDIWRRTMDGAFNFICGSMSRTPYIHGLRMQGVGADYPFGSVDSADIARNQNRPQNTIQKMADRWDKRQPKSFRWTRRPEQQELIA